MILEGDPTTEGVWTRCSDECDHDGPFLIQYGDTVAWTYYEGGAEAGTLMDAGFRVQARDHKCAHGCETA